MGTYGFAQFQIDVRKSDEDLKRATDEFKRQKRVDEREESTMDEAKLQNGFTEQ